MSETDHLRPAFACNAACRVVWLRKKISEFPPEVQKALAPFCAPLPFEAELLSGSMECGGTFTYRDAKQNGGDWQDSYCGC